MGRASRAKAAAHRQSGDGSSSRSNRRRGGQEAIFRDFCALLRAGLATNPNSWVPSPAAWAAQTRYFSHPESRLFTFMATTDLVCDVLEQRAEARVRRYRC